MQSSIKTGIEFVKDKIKGLTKTYESKMAMAVRSDVHTKVKAELIEREIDSFLGKTIHQLDEIG